MNPEMLWNKDGFRQIPDQSLPIFSRQIENLTLFYAPGYLAATISGDGLREAGLPLGPENGSWPNPFTGYLIRAAKSAHEKWLNIHNPANYKPVCLTLYTSLKCNLRCSYCFAECDYLNTAILDLEFIRASAREILRNCAELQKPFTLVFHGGGEPTLDPRVPDFLTELKQMSMTEGVPFRSYIATNGVMDMEKTRYLAENFDEIGLSVDGPPDIQNHYRPLRNGLPSAEIVERTARILKETLGKLTVRVTVVPDNFGRIPEIAAYCRDGLGADEIRMEPVYLKEKMLKKSFGETELSPSHEEDNTPQMADKFCIAFLKAKRDGYPLSYSGSRISEIHGRYCRIFQKCMQLVPPAGRSVCFLHSSQKEIDSQTLTQEDPLCVDCFNRFHCARGCPDICPGTAKIFHDAGSFRCRVNRTLAEAELMDCFNATLKKTAQKYGFAGVKFREF